MTEHLTLMRPDPRNSGSPRISSTLPPDLLEQVRKRVSLLATLMLIGFSLDPFFFGLGWIMIMANEGRVPPEFYRDSPFLLMDLGGIVASAGLWWAARNSRISSSVLHSVGQGYEILICFVIAYINFWQYHRDHGILPNLTWVPAVIMLFPLILPGRPRRMLLVSSVAAAMLPLSLLVLTVQGKLAVDVEGFLNTTIGGVIAVGFAYAASRVVYGLGREVVAARELGSYQLETKLGQGGMGEVWRARHRMLARPAAIKLIRPSVGEDGQTVISEMALQRFEREAQVIARLRSPHTIELFDFGRSEDGSFYYVMELLDGLDAQKLVHQFGPVPPERAIYLVRQICHSLTEANASGLIHRDIKPANIFLCRYGQDYDFVKVLDFGLVKGLDQALETGPGLTRENAVNGTPAFIAPEQALGNVTLDGRADVYATGCVAYWLLTGQLVFTGSTAMGLLLQHVQSEPAAPSTRTDLPIPPLLDQLILSCLSKNPAHRPQSARELSDRLGELQLEGLWTEQRARDWWDTHQPIPA
ncbi:MAG: serine/threonine-protein kinase [Gemmatimonadota bacterium]